MLNSLFGMSFKKKLDKSYFNTLIQNRELFSHVNISICFFTVKAFHVEVDSALNITNVLTERMEKIDLINANITMNLDMLKDMIQQAREEANTVRSF